jgi:hypothetical protein
MTTRHQRVLEEKRGLASKPTLSPVERAHLAEFDLLLGHRPPKDARLSPAQQERQAALVSEILKG